MRTGLWCLDIGLASGLAFFTLTSAGCDVLWGGFGRDNPKPEAATCDVDPTVCSTEQVCSLSQRSCMQLRDFPDAATLSMVGPGIGPSNGGLQITLRGANFRANTGVSFDGAPASNVTLISDSELSATLPSRPGRFGLVPVTVTSPELGVAFSRADQFYYYLADIALTEQPVIKLTEVPAPSALTVTDYNNDRKLDVQVGGADSVALLYNEGALNLYPKKAMGVSGQLMTLLSGDFNGDGYSDLFAHTSSGSEFMLLQNKGGTDTATFRIPTNTLAKSVISADLNGDKLLDVVAVYDKDFAIDGLLAQDKDPWFSARRTAMSPITPCYIVAAELILDPGTDLAVTSCDTADVLILKGKGDGSFEQLGVFKLGDVAASVAAADLNGDKWPELITAHSTKSFLSVLRGTGDGMFSDPLNYGTGEGPTQIAVADIDRDRNIDVVVLRPMFRAVEVLRGRGDGTLGSVFNLAIKDGSPTALTVTDIDGDGKPDVLVSVQNPDGLLILTNTSK